MENRIYFEKIASEDDFKYALELDLNEKVMEMNYGRVFTLDESKMIFEYMLRCGKEHDKFGYFKAFEVSTNKFIGIGGLPVDDELTEAELEYLLLPEFWGKGYGSEIARLLLNTAEETESMKKVSATISPDNIGSKKILLKNGFEPWRIYRIIDDGSLAEDFSKEIVH